MKREKDEYRKNSKLTDMIPEEVVRVTLNNPPKKK